MTAQLGLLALLEAKPDKAGELAAFLAAGAKLAADEPRTITWYAFKIDETTYGIFDTFATEEARQAHLNGPIAAALGEVAPALLSGAPSIRPVELIAIK
jgi:quinol monooxygenase YgiN